MTHFNNLKPNEKKSKKKTHNVKIKFEKKI